MCGRDRGGSVIAVTAERRALDREYRRRGRHGRSLLRYEQGIVDHGMCFIGALSRHVKVGAREQEEQKDRQGPSWVEPVTRIPFRTPMN